MITGRSIGGFASKRLLGDSRDPRHTDATRHMDAITLDHLIHLRKEAERLEAENVRLKDKIWLLQQELKRIENE
jgi:hypothetical protein